MFSHCKSQIVTVALLIVLAALFVGAAPAQASVCTLADHIRSANTNTAVGFCPAGTSHDIITIAEDITLTEPLPPITGTITIEGGGHTISGDNKFPIFVVRGGRLTVNNLTLTEGYFEGSWEKGWAAAGGIQVRNGGRATVNNSTFINNRSGKGHGGAIAVDSSELTVNNSSFLKNRSSGQGGAIYVWDSKASINNSSFVENSVSSIHTGGGVYVGFRSQAAITNSTFFYNQAYYGGAVGTDYTSEGPRSTTVTNSTMINNIATYGQSVFAHEGDPTFNLRNSILSSFVTSGGSLNCHGRLNQNIGNLIADGSCSPAIDGDPMIAELTKSPVHFPLLDGSPALDAADSRYCPDRDQLGRARPQGGGCDIGAIESTTAIPAPTPAATLCILPDQIIAANTDRPYKACPAGKGADIIHMIRDYELSEALPGITSEITIEGNGYTISGSSVFAILDVDGGKLTITDATLADGQASKGGAIRLRNGAAVTAYGIRFIDNKAVRGGAIAVESANDQLAVRDSSFVGNSAETIGGAILVEGGQVDISGSAFLNNRSTETGGAVAVTGGQAALSNSTLNGNESARGGGFHIVGGEATLTHLTLMNNVAEHIVGAGIYAQWGQLSLRNSIIGGSGIGIDCFGSIHQSRGNFSEDGACSNSVGGDPLLGDLVGSPEHHPLLDASPAHGTADPAFCLPFDQLGNPRPHCDIGAIESARDPNFTAVPAASLPENCTLPDQIITANTDAPVGACPAGAGVDTIALRGSVSLAEALPTITSDITIDGRGHTIDGNNRARIFAIDSGAVVIKNMELVNGVNPDGYGGAITLRHNAELTVANVNFRNNKARYGGAIASIDSADLKVYDSIFLDNIAEEQGGAVWNDGACGHLDNNQFRRSRTGEEGRSQTESGLNTEIHLDGSARQCAPVMTNTYSDE
ncbi:MAG: right-handed parallel beta-helix repeat-containing protein [Chloroflexi bacterium]|nr:right-handed parallel beta-helix repeat-containing protein [Chloroflexota bacterium]